MAKKDDKPKYKSTEELHEGDCIVVTQSTYKMGNDKIVFEHKRKGSFKNVQLKGGRGTVGVVYCIVPDGEKVLGYMQEDKPMKAKKK